MQIGFPLSLLGLVRCPNEGGELTADGSDEWIADGRVACGTCGATFDIGDGILRLLPGPPTHHESAREMTLRDAGAEALTRQGRENWTSAFSEATEIAPTFAALAPLSQTLCLELGCGSGRFTFGLLDRGSTVVAADFSVASLARLRSRVPVTAPVAPRTFHRALSTLHTNLPTRDHRMATIGLAADALRDGGRFAFGLHYHGLRDLVRGEPAAGYYAANGIYRYHMRRPEVRREVAPYFARVRFEALSVSIPGVPVLAVARLARHVPLVRELAGLLLAVCEEPRRAPVPRP